MNPHERVARAAVDEAAVLLREAWLETKEVHYKGDVDLVTATDHRVEALIVERLQAAFPDHLIIAEEAHGDAPIASKDWGEDDYVWYLDPLDGTTNFAHGYPQFAVSLALARGHEMQFALVHDPIRDECFVANRGEGATLNGQPITVSDVSDLARGLIATGFPYDRRAHADYYLGFFRQFLRAAQGMRRNGSAALDLCYVACGRLDGFWEWKLRPWDVAAGVLLVREAGGRVSDFRDAPFDLHGEQTLASNGLVHAGMAALLTAQLDSVSSEVAS